MRDCLWDQKCYSVQKMVARSISNEPARKQLSKTRTDFCWCWQRRSTERFSDILYMWMVFSGLNFFHRFGFRHNRNEWFILGCFVETEILLVSIDIFQPFTLGILFSSMVPSHWQFSGSSLSSYNHLSPSFLFPISLISSQYFGTGLNPSFPSTDFWTLFSPKEFLITTSVFKISEFAIWSQEYFCARF